jgi:hypothetical protein
VAQVGFQQQIVQPQTLVVLAVQPTGAVVFLRHRAALRRDSLFAAAAVADPCTALVVLKTVLIAAAAALGLMLSVAAPLAEAVTVRAAAGAAAALAAAAPQVMVPAVMEGPAYLV